MIYSTQKVKTPEKRARVVSVDEEGFDVPAP